MQVNAGTLDLNGNQQSVTSFSGSTNAALVTSSLPGGLLDITNEASPATYAGTIADGTGNVALVYAGPSSLFLTGANAYSGGTTISGGTLQINSSSSLGSGSLAIGPGALEVSGLIPSSTRNITLTGAATISVDAGMTYVTSGTLSGSGPLTVSGQGFLGLTGINSYTGGTNLTGGTLQINSSSSLGSGTLAMGPGTLEVSGNIPSSTRNITLTGPATISVDSGYAVTNSGTMSGPGVLTKAGPGLLNLSGPNTYGGGTTLSGGSLQLGSSTALGTGGLTDNGWLDLNGISPATALPTLNGTSGTISSGIAGAITLTVTPTAASAFGGVIGNGNGTLSLTVSGGTVPLVLYGTNTYTNGTTITTGGSLTLGNGSFNGVVAGNIADSGALTFNNPAAQAYTGLLSGTGALNVSGAALLTLTGSNTGFTGLTTITSAGSLQIGNGVANAWLGATAIADSGTLIWSNTGSQTLRAHHRQRQLDQARQRHLGPRRIERPFRHGHHRRGRGPVEQPQRAERQHRRQQFGPRQRLDLRQ